MTLNRQEAPKFKNIEDIPIIKPERFSLDNGVNVWQIKAGTQEVSRLDLIFGAGIWQQDKILTAQLCNSMLNEGTENYSYQQISGLFDYYGNYLHLKTEKHKALITLHSLNKHLPHTLPLLEEVARKSVFPESEFQTLLANRKQKNMLDSQKVSYMAQKLFSQALYGPNHPYGQFAMPQDYDAIGLHELKKFYKGHYHPGNMELIASGNITDSTLKLLNKHFGSKDWPALANMPEKKQPEEPEKKLRLHQEKDGAVQTAIRMGRSLFNRKHPDYIGMQLLSTVLGGYFGSRLMGNLREDKGLTYGVGSGLLSLEQSGLFVILTEVKKEAAEEAISEINKEIKLLQNELVSDDELSLVKTQILGELLNNLDGAFAQAEAFRLVHDLGLDIAYMKRFVKTIREFKAKDLRELANKYLLAEELYTVTAG